MSNKEAELGPKVLDGTLGQEESVEIQVEKGPVTASESSSFPDGNNEPQSNLTSSTTSTLQRPQQIFEDSTANLPPATIPSPQQQATANLLPNSTSAVDVEAEPEAKAEGEAEAEAETEADAEAENEVEAEASTVQTAAATVAGGLFQLAEDSSNQNETRNQLLLFPHYRLPASNFTATITNPHSPISMKMSWPDNSLSALPLPNFPSLNLHSPGQGTQSQFYSPYNTRYLRNSLYDPMYEVLGLPVDPHLRMLVIMVMIKNKRMLDMVE